VTAPAGRAEAGGVGAAASIWERAALLVAAVGLAGSLFLSLGLGLQACPLCFYQRAFAMAAAAVLATGLATGASRPATLALPLAVAGLGVGAYHVALEVAGSLECPPGVFGLGTAPQQSLAVFSLLVVLLAADVLQQPALSPGPLGQVRGKSAVLVTAAVLGGLMAVASTVANPPARRPPPEAYATPPEVCRPPL
jgi:disulfide bond formation protein DsbB